MNGDSYRLRQSKSCRRTQTKAADPRSDDAASAARNHPLADPDTGEITDP